MLWVILAALGATANAAYFIATKRLLATFDRDVLAAGGFFATGIFLLTFALLRGIPPPGDELLMAVAATTLLNIVATTLVFRALSTTDISLAVPMISFTPVFLIATSFLLLGETPSPLGIAGICIIVAGSYVLNLSSAHTRWSDPIRAILKNRGTASMLLVAFIYAIALNFDKMVVLNSDPVFGSSLVCLALGVSFFLIGQVKAWHRRAIHDGTGRRIPPDAGTAERDRSSLEPYHAGVLVFVIIGLLVTVEAVSVNYAFTMQITPYVIAIKRMSIILTVFYGTLIAREGDVARRLAGALLMVAGAVLIILSG